jgi:hypothetical protein
MIVVKEKSLLTYIDHAFRVSIKAAVIRYRDFASHWIILLMPNYNFLIFHVGF